MRIVLFGYGEMGCTGLEFLLSQKEDVAAVITHRDDPAEKRWYRSLVEVATSAKVPVVYGEEVDLRNTVAGLKPELILSFYYRSMIPMEVLINPGQTTLAFIPISLASILRILV